MLENVDLYSDMFFNINHITNGGCGGYYTRIDEFNFFCKRETADTPERHLYCESVFVDSFEALLPESPKELPGDTTSSAS